MYLRIKSKKNTASSLDEVFLSTYSLFGTVHYGSEIDVGNSFVLVFGKENENKCYGWQKFCSYWRRAPYRVVNLCTLHSFRSWSVRGL